MRKMLRPTMTRIPMKPNMKDPPTGTLPTPAGGRRIQKLFILHMNVQHTQKLVRIYLMWYVVDHLTVEGYCMWDLQEMPSRK